MKFVVLIYNYRLVLLKTKLVNIAASANLTNFTLFCICIKFTGVSGQCKSYSCRWYTYA